MTVPSDPFTFSPSTTIASSQVNARFAPLYAALTGALDVDNLLSTLAERLGLSSGATVRRGKSIVAASQSRSNAAYGVMATPDRVASVVLPTDGLIFIAYQAVWQESVNGAARAAIFIGSNQLKIAQSNSSAPSVQETACYMAANTDGPLATCGGGLVTVNDSANVTAYGGDVTTGQAIGDAQLNSGGGPCCVFAAAGTYDVSVQFKASSGSVTVRNRRLWVWTMGF